MASPAQTPTRWNPEWTKEFLARPIDPVEMTPLYRLGLVGVAATLILLQTVYVLLVLALVAATCWYALLLPGIFETVRVNIITLSLAMAPLVAGAVASFFMFKPLLQRSKPPEPLLTLEREEEPEFFAFVDRLCELVGSPKPRRVTLDLQVNASAALNRGWASMVSGDLMLNVGLPLVRGFTLRQFAGVLAHEFGHFSQKAGLRLHFLIASSRMWFARVAFERDDWDMWLEGMNEDAGWRSKPVWGIAVLTVKASRLILRGLLRTGDIVSAWFSRQMEFDADRHEAGLVGAEVFQQTTIRLSVLGYICQRAWNSVDNGWRSNRLPTDFVKLVEHMERDGFNINEAEVLANIMASRTGKWDSHPCGADRIGNVTGKVGVVPASGPWGEDVPASILFRDFEGLSRRVTAAHYGVTVGEDAQRAELVEGEVYAEEVVGGIKRDAAVAEKFGNCDKPARWFRVDVSAEQGEGVPPRDEQYWELLGRWLDQRSGACFLEAGGKIAPASFQLVNQDLGEARRTAERTWLLLKDERSRLARAYGHVAAGVLAPDELKQAYAAFSNEQEQLLELRSALSDYRVTQRNLEFLTLEQGADASSSAVKRMRQLREEIEAKLRANSIVAKHLGETPERDTEEARSAYLLDRTDEVGQELLSDLLADAWQLLTEGQWDGALGAEAGPEA